jgi:UPF0755 protein
MPEHRRIFVGFAALVIAAGCVCLLLFLLWPRDVAHNGPGWRQIANDTSYSFGSDIAPPAKALPLVTVQGVPEPVDPKAFGGLASISFAKPSLAASDVAKLFRDMDAWRQTREAMWGSERARFVGTTVENLAKNGPVVQGVNDQPAADEIAAADAPAASGPIQSYPMSAAATADLQNRAALYGVRAGAPSGSASVMANADLAAAPPLHPGARPRAFDASEGTPLDPLLNTTYDLNYPKAIPSLK